MTLRCVRSILNAGYSPDRVFCFDNGSTPGNGKAVREAFPRVHHDRISQNRGFSGGFNAALNWVFSTGVRSVLFLTNDTEMLPGAVEACRNSADRTEAELVAPCVMYRNRPGKIDSIGAFFHPERCSLVHYREQDLPDELTGETDYIPGTALWIARDAFERLGGADESFHTYWEDVHLCFRARRLNIGMARAYSSRILHGVGQTCHKKALYTTYYFQRNRIRFCRSTLPEHRWKQARSVIESDLEGLRERFEQRNDVNRLQLLDRLKNEFDGIETSF